MLKTNSGAGISSVGKKTGQTPLSLMPVCERKKAAAELYQNNGVDLKGLDLV